LQKITFTIPVSLPSRRISPRGVSSEMKLRVAFKRGFLAKLINPFSCSRRRSISLNCGHPQSIRGWPQSRLLRACSHGFENVGGGAFAEDSLHIHLEVHIRVAVIAAN